MNERESHWLFLELFKGDEKNESSQLEKKATSKNICIVKTSQLEAEQLMNEPLMTEAAQTNQLISFDSMQYDALSNKSAAIN